MKLSVARCLFAALAAAPAFAQQPPAGYAAQTTALPANAGAVLVLPDLQRVWFDGQALRLGQPTAAPLLSFAAPVFASFTIDAGGGHVLFGESSNGGLWLVPLQGPAPAAPLGTATFNYDAALLGPGRAVVSAKTGGFSTPDNDLLVVDLRSGAQQLLARLPGASGPVAVDRQGDLYYATASLAFPTPPGQTQVLRFRRARLEQALLTNTTLGVADAELVASGLDAAGDLACDDDGDLLYVDWLRGVVGELSDVGSSAPVRSDLLDYATSPAFPGSVQFVAAGGPAVFEPFQPAGGRLLVVESVFGGPVTLREVAAARPTLSTAAANPIATGPFAVDCHGGPAGSLCLFALALPGPLGELPLPLGGEAPLFWNFASFGAVATWLGTTDAQGHASLALANPGFPVPVDCQLQWAGLAGSSGGLASSAPLRLRLGQ